MEPTLTIIEYLWDARNEWLKHNDQCTCPFGVLAQSFLDQVTDVKDWLDITESEDGRPITGWIRMTRAEWDDYIGPVAQKKMLDEMATTLMNKASELIAMTATWDRMSGSHE